MAERSERLRDRTVSQIKVILKFAETINDATPLEAIATRLETLETRYQAFNEYEVTLFAFEEYKPITEVVDEIYYKARTILTQAASKRSPTYTDAPDLNLTLEQFITQQRTFYENINSAKQARLPKVTIEPFSGNYQYWPSFHDLYTTTVHETNNLSNVHKFQILNGLLRGDAASLIRHIAITEANYTEAWDKLCKRYNKLNPIMNSLLQTFFEQKSCQQANGKELRRIAENADEVIRGLRALGSEAESRDPWLIYIMLSKIDAESKQLWAKQAVDKNFPTFDEFIKFLNVRCDAIEMCETTIKKPSSAQRSPARAFLINDDKSLACIVCNDPHFIYKCPTFKNMTAEARNKVVINNDLCNNCLRIGHTSSKCYNRVSCLICNKRHHTLLHHSQFSTTISSPSPKPTTSHHVWSNELPNFQFEEIQLVKPKTILQSAETNHSNNLHTHTLFSTHDTILPTALVYITSCTGQLQPARILLDSGSQMSFVTESCIQNLGLKRLNATISINGLASTPAGKTKGKTDMTIVSRVNKQYAITVTAHIIPRITNLLPIKQHRFMQHSVLQSLELADPEFYKHNVIDVLLGADAFFEILSPEQKKIPGLPALQNSQFGWLIAGSLIAESANTSNFHTTINTTTISSHEEDVNQSLKRFWEIEEIPDQPHLTSSKNWCESYYIETTTSDANGRVSVRLPFHQPRQQLGNSWLIARRRLLAMERRFTTSPEFFKSYKEFIHEYINLGHMHYIPFSEIPADDNAKYFIPHHAVMKSTSSTTKLRVVFDASCKTTSSVSLNDTLQVGPNIQRDLTTIILRFREPIIALVADVEKMYRQIKVNPIDTNYQLILWRDNPNDPIKVYKLDTVTYGTACAPYLAVRTLQRSSEDFKDVYPNASQIICNDFYIDDLLTGCDSLEDAILIKDQLITILGSSGFQLRKWKSNSSEFLNSFSKDDIQNIPKLLEDDSSIKTLGIMWNAESDTFSFKVQEADINVNWTKRRVLSAASKVYDPLGWLAPTVILFKIILQKLWLMNIDWDTILPDDITKIWKNVYDNLIHLENTIIPRCLTSLKNRKSVQLHAFCDASEAAFGSVIYLRAEDECGEVTVTIVCAKGRVAPLKQISLPRLELCGAVLLSDLVKFCVQSLEYKNVEVYAWTDSMIVLHWLSDVPRRWKSFIANRTSKILDSIPRSKWAHVESKSNPADYITRGVKPQLISSLTHWWKGPQWLFKEACCWPVSNNVSTDVSEICVEERSRFVNVFVETASEDIITQLTTKCSSWFKLRKIMVYILRVCKQNKLKPRNLAVSPAELNEAEIVILRNIQKTTLGAELSVITKGDTLSEKHYLSSLDPFIDANGLFRVGGRLRHSQLKYTVKHPIILQKDHPINELIIRELHYTNMHASNSLVLTILRQRYWMIGARYAIKRCIKLCVICIRHRSIKNDQKMGDLPTARCSISRPFLKTGLDYAGPIQIKSSKRKNAPTEKAYIAVFVCLCVKAVHLEVVSSLESDSFLAALKRFVSRRGLPEEIWCDNATNFIGADRELRRMKQSIINQQQNKLISQFLLQKNITFHFIPPRAPNFGGLWEASVKSFKYHLRRVIDANFTFEELTTIVIQIESLLNSRPLCRIDDDPGNLQMLTPGHFLIGEPLIAIPEPALDAIPMNKLSRWQNVQRRVQGFFKCWSRDYLSTLQHRYKWKAKSEQLNIDDVILIKEDNVYPNQWLLGRVTNIHPGPDGIVRVVTLKTAHSEMKRPVNKLIKLPVKTN